MKKLYKEEAWREIQKVKHFAEERFTEAEMAHLPPPVQKHFRVCGYIGKKKMMNAETIWDKVFLKMAPDKKWMPLVCYQFNSIMEPSRLAYMKKPLLGALPLLEARDKFQDGEGKMLIKLLKGISIADAQGLEMNQSGLVTVLAETFLLPAYALQPYMTWIEVDSERADAVMTYGGLQVQGSFYFDKAGFFIRFETNDRYYADGKNTYKKVKWSGVVDHYIEQNGVKFPAHFEAIWHTDDGNYPYFKGEIKSINYNIPDLIQ